MAKDITTKDVLYALEYMADAMERQPNGKWIMASSRAPVRESIANEVRASGLVFAVAERDGRQRIVWLEAA
jgi:hypothetical protein